MPAPASPARRSLPLGRLVRLTLSALGMAFAAGASAQEAAPAIPNFWDPAVRTERPAEGVITGIRFVTTDDFPPFNFNDAGNRLTGFNVDLARAICAELQVPCTIQARPWTDLVPSVVEGRADAIIAGLAISEESRRSLAFSDVSLELPARFAVRSALPLEVSPTALAGKRVAVVAGSAHLAYLEAYFPLAIPRIYTTPEAARSALRTGQADVAFGDALQLGFWFQGVTAGNCCAFAGGPYVDTHFFGEGLAVGLRPDAVELRAAINSAMEALAAKGVYADLYLRYFPFGLF